MGDSLTTMYEGIRGALAADDAPERQGMEARFRVRETLEWYLHAAEPETEMLSRGTIFEVIDWSEDQTWLPFRGMMGRNSGTRPTFVLGGSKSFPLGDSYGSDQVVDRKVKIWISWRSDEATGQADDSKVPLLKSAQRRHGSLGSTFEAGAVSGCARESHIFLKPSGPPNNVGCWG